jgi:hypothetical protein
MPPGVGVSELESDGGDEFFCAGGGSAKVRTVRRPHRGRQRLLDPLDTTSEMSIVPAYPDVWSTRTWPDAEHWSYLRSEDQGKLMKF